MFVCCVRRTVQIQVWARCPDWLRAMHFLILHYSWIHGIHVLFQFVLISRWSTLPVNSQSYTLSKIVHARTRQPPILPSHYLFRILKWIGPDQTGPDQTELDWSELTGLNQIKWDWIEAPILIMCSTFHTQKKRINCVCNCLQQQKQDKQKV